MCRVKSDPSSRDLAVWAHKELTVTLSEILEGGRWKNENCFINLGSILHSSHDKDKDDELLLLLLFSNIWQKCC